MAKIPKYKDVPYGIRQNPERRWNYLADLLNGSEEEDSSEPESSKRNISINVNDGTDPIQGASVVIGETSKTTGRAGGCKFDVADGRVSVVISKDGFVDKTEEITVSEDNTSFTFSLSVFSE